MRFMRNSVTQGHARQELDVFVRTSASRTLLGLLAMYLILGAVAGGAIWLASRPLPPASEASPLFALLRSMLMRVRLYSGAVAEGAVLVAILLPFFSARAVWRLFRHKPLLHMDAQGIRCGNQPELGLIPWTDIEDCQASTARLGFRKLDYLCLKLRNEAEYWMRAGRGASNFKAHFGLPDFPLAPLVETTPATADVLAFIDAHIVK